MFRRLLAALALIAPAILLSAPAADAAVLSTFKPGAEWLDTTGKPLQLHGLGILKSGSTWYAVGENKVGKNSGDASFREVSCYSSPDLSRWTYKGAALSLQASGDLGPNRIVERPKILFNASTGKYVMYLHIDSSNYGEAKVGVATSDTPCGAYTYRGSFRPLGFESRDIGVFQDDDGAGYLLTEDRAHGLRIDRLSADYLTVVSPVALLPTYESPAMVKADGRYYLMGSRLTGWNTNDNVYATATSPAGPWTDFRNFAPVGTNTYNSQNTNIIPVTGTQGTTYVFAGDRWNLGDLGASPMIWLPITFGSGTLSVSWQRSWTLDVTAGTWTGTSNPATGISRELLNENSWQVMDLDGTATADGTKIVQRPGGQGTRQRWKLVQIKGNVYELRNVATGKCLEVPGSSLAWGEQLDEWTCDGGANQRWALQATGDYGSSGGPYVLTNLHSGRLADVADNSTTAGTRVVQWEGTGGRNQTWYLY